MDYNNGLNVDGLTTETNALNNELKFKNNIVAATTTGKAAYVNATGNNASFNIATWYAAGNNTTVATNAGLLIKPYDLTDATTYTGLDYRPATGSIALTGADFTDSSLLATKDFTSAISEFYLSLYPNPYTNTFKLNYISNSDDSVKVAIYDLTGKLLETRTVEYADINNQEMGNGYVPGIYIVVLKQADISKSVRVIKK